MDSKFYVSLEVARLLKEKGYTKTIEDFDFVYLKDGSLSPRVFLHTSPFIAAPTKAEAINWIESKGIIIEVLQDYRGLWFYVIKISETESYVSESDDKYFPTRLEAEKVAIIKACELL